MDISKEDAIQSDDFNQEEKPVRVIAISAGKGGVGKSTISINLSIALSEMGKRVMLLDADLGLANIDIMLGLQAPRNLSNVLKGECRLRDVMLVGPEDICIIPSASGNNLMTGLSISEHAGIVDAFNEITEPLDYLIIDTAAGISETVLSFIRSSQEVIIVTCDEPASLTDSYALMKMLNKRFQWHHFHVVVNMARQLKEGFRIFNQLDHVTGQYLDVSLNFLGVVPFDEHVHESVKKQRAVLIEAPNCKASHAFRYIANSLQSFQMNKPVGSNTSFFLKRLFIKDLNTNIQRGP